MTTRLKMIFYCVSAAIFTAIGCAFAVALLSHDDPEGAQWVILATTIIVFVLFLLRFGLGEGQKP